MAGPGSRGGGGVGGAGGGRLGLGFLVDGGLGDAGGASRTGAGFSPDSSGSCLGAPSWFNCSWSGVSSRSWSSGASLSSRSWVFSGFRLWLGSGFLSSLLDLYSDESSSCSWSWPWASDGPGAVGPTRGADFFAGAAGLGLADADGAVGALVKRTCLSLGSEMVAIWSEQFSPGVCSRPFKGTRRGPVLQGQGRRRVICPLPKINGCT